MTLRVNGLAEFQPAVKVCLHEDRGIETTDSLRSMFMFGRNKQKINFCKCEAFSFFSLSSVK